MNKILAGKTAFVSGASRGVGMQVSFALAQLGCDVILHARKLENLENIKKQFDKIGACFYEVEGELSDLKNVEKIIRNIEAKQLQVDIIYNNAGWGAPNKENIFNHDWEDWEKSFRINVIALYYFIAAFVPGMIERKYGRIINLTSRIKHQPQLAPYGASKAAVDKLTDDLAVNMPKGVRINTLDPGWLRTDMGGSNAEHPVDAVLPGAIIPVLIEDDGPNGQFFSAIDYSMDLVNKFRIERMKPATQ
jgi:short-subunit dehydrogenase